MLTAIFVILGTTLTVIQAFEKWGWLESYEVVRKKWMPEGFCYLCMSFWLSIPVAMIYYVLLQFNLHFLLVPFTCAGFINCLAIIIKK